ncbi:dirigent protein 22 [Triticum aestivum]|nr:dirigent protein 22-like [Triticum aestivum]
MIRTSKRCCLPLIPAMACFNLNPTSFALAAAVAIILAVASPRPAAGASAHLHVYMHDVMGDSAMMVVRGPRGNFGNTVVMDDVLTEGTSASSAAVGRAQGQYIVASSKGGFELMVTMNVVLTSGAYTGSSVTVMGRDDTGVAVRELAVVGGTGQFRMAKGYVLWKTVRPDLLELDIFVNP